MVRTINSKTVILGYFYYSGPGPDNTEGKLQVEQVVPLVKTVPVLKAALQVSVWEGSPPPTHVTSHVPNVMCHLSYAMCHMSHVTYFFKMQMDKVGNQVGGGCVICGAYRV